MINYRASIVISCFSLSLTIALFCYRNNASQSTFFSSANVEQKIDRELLSKIEATTVKVILPSSSGSGLVIEKNNNSYTVVTNRHVANRGDKYQIQTVDNDIYQGRLLTMSSKNDLAILQFTSDRIYPVAAINLKLLKPNEPLFTAGFPFNSDRLTVTSGKMLLETKKPLKQGYQLGYSNPIEKGMSGGAVFNSLGEVVGINGRSANPIIPDYQYQDLTYPSQRLQKQMAQLSWGIPIAKAIKLNSNY